MDKKMDKLVSLAKHRGFIFPGSEIYGGLANSWDYGPIGVELKNNIKKAWWKKFIQESPLNIGIDAAILMNPRTWEASGHINNFTDPLIDCKSCKTRHRADKLIEESLSEKGIVKSVEGLSFSDMIKIIEENSIKCPICGSGEFTNIRRFNLMYKTYQGVTEETANEIYLRPETAQGIFVNFKNVMRSMRKELPFGIGQIGKSFRNEITPGNFIYRIREFEQMELEFFCKPNEAQYWYNYWKDFCYKWLLSLGMSNENIKLREHDKQELSHYSDATVDIEYNFPFGWGELWGIANRTDFDLKQHMKYSKNDMTVKPHDENISFIPYCIEPSLGADRVTLAFLLDAYTEEELDNGDTRVHLKLHPNLAPYKVAVLPLSKKLTKEANLIFTELSTIFSADFDDSGSIGKRYRRQDEIGTPLCVTYDFDSQNDHSVTVRDRNTMGQIRVKIDELPNYINKYIKF
ncbi:glycine--tRNA ligase [Metabacillus halosaccharovorans]|uniref:glycine--tRNA ligase n=1 Tax=Metabacillus halosaccharovorans TaxID=930124 RepID=UPI001C1FC57C|nr:glycine--tRNA ligase [Metabacillus halosaccharovorans]MBU7595708.1 glycine--tRNA ligase [Metabacillus halosaccharovorans]